MKSALAENTVIKDKYFVESVIPSNQTNQINYRCIDKSTNQMIVLKEFYPLYAVRSDEGLLEYSKSHTEDMERFIYANKQSQLYSKLPTIPNVSEMFACNNTYYAVCECFYGQTVEELIAKGYEFTKTTVRNILVMLLKTNLSLSKFNLCNKNFRPDNILITTDGYVKLREFCPDNNMIYETEATKSIAALGFYMATGADTDEDNKLKGYRSDPKMQDLLKYTLGVVNTEQQVRAIDFYNAALAGFDSKLLSVPSDKTETVGKKSGFLSRISKKKKLLMIITALILVVILALTGIYKAANTFKKKLDTSTTTKTSREK